MTWTVLRPGKYIIALAMAGAIATLAWLMWPDSTLIAAPPSDQAIQLPPAVTSPPSIEIPETKTPNRPPIKALPKTPSVRAKTGLPPAMLDGAETYLMATGSLQSEGDRAYVLTSVLDRRTGETQVYAKAEPLPWFSVSDAGSFGVHYGLKGGDPVVRASISHEVARIKAIRFGARGSLDSDGEWFAGIGAEIKW